jgi:hypothetical protein
VRKWEIPFCRRQSPFEQPNRSCADIPICYQDRTCGETAIRRWKHAWLLLRMALFAARKLKFT